MKVIIALLTLIISFSSFAQAHQAYPEGPDIRLTPGSLCVHPSEYRYPEKIAYCVRDVSPETKDYIFKEYQKELGYSLGDRHVNYKVDHFIPLCAGGSNNEDNLWPQHVTVYTKTDPLEELGCKKLALGKIKQNELVILFKQVKRNLTLVGKATLKLNSL